MKTKKSLLALVLVLAMLALMMAGCAKTSTETTETNPETESTEAPAQTEESETAEAPAEEAPEADDGEESAEPVTEGEGPTQLAIETFGENVQPQEWTLPLSDGSESMVLAATFPDPLFASYPNGMADCDIYQEAERVTGVKMEYLPLSTSASSEQFNIMMASGDYPALVGWGLSYTGGDEKAVEDEVYIDVRDLVAQYSPNYYKILSTDDELLETALTDSGYLTGFMAVVTENGLAQYGPQVRVDLLEKLGMDKPYTIDEWHDVLTAFKTELGLDEPLVFPAGGCAQDNFICSAFGVNGYISNFPQSVAPWYVEDGTVKFGCVEQGYLEYLELVKSWYDEGLMDKDYISTNTNFNSPDYQAKIQGGQCGIWFSDYGNIGNYNSLSEVEGFHAEATYDAHASEDSVNHFAKYSKKSAGNGFRITTNCEYPELAAQWADWWYTEEGSLLANYGIEGRGLEFDENGNPALSDMLLNTPGVSVRDALLVYASNNTICCVVDSHALDTTYSQEDIEAPEIWNTGMDDSYVMPSTVSLKTDEQEELNSIYTDVETMCIENISKFITGTRSLDEFDQFVSEVRSVGLDRCLEIYQGAYDRAMSK